MDVVKVFLTQELPSHLAALPIPSTVQGFLELNQAQWIQLVPVLLIVFAHVIILSTFFSSSEPVSGRVNTQIDLQSAKVCEAH